jgi:hypothetical protein
VAPDKPSIKDASTTVTSATVNVGATFSFTCIKAATGEVPSTWEWYKGVTKLSAGVTGAVYSKTAVAGDAGTYTCKALIAAFKSVASDVLTLTVNGGFCFNCLQCVCQYGDSPDCIALHYSLVVNPATCIDQSKTSRGDIHEALALSQLLFGPMHPIVHRLPSKRFAWSQSCEGFVNMSPWPTRGVASLRQTTDFTPGCIAERSCREELLNLAGMMT